MRRRSARPIVISAGVPGLVSSSSGMTTRFIVDSAESSRHFRRVRASGRRTETADAPKLLHFCQFFFEQLLVIEIGIVAVFGHEFVVSTQLHDSSGMENGDAVRVAHGR